MGMSFQQSLCDRLPEGSALRSAPWVAIFLVDLDVFARTTRSICSWLILGTPFKGTLPGPALANNEPLITTAIRDL